MPASRTHKLRVMLDSNVLVAGIIWTRFPRQVLNHALTGDYQLVTTTYILDEVREHVLRLRPARADALEQVLYDTQYELVPEALSGGEFARPDLVRDPDDLPIVLAAIDAKVDFLISQDKDITDPSQPVHEHLRIILPGAFLREYMGWSSDDLERVRTAQE